MYANGQLQLGVHLTVLSRRPDIFALKMPHLANHASISLIQGDVRSFTFPEGEFPFVIHAATAASAKLNQEDPLLVFDTILAGTQRTLEFARTHGTRKLLFTSSGAVYGQQPPDLAHVPEDYAGAPDAMQPGSAYGEGKRAAEMLCSLYASQFGFEAKISRCFAFVGPHLPLNAHFAIGNFIRDALQGGPIRVSGDGTAYRSYLYAADLAVWLWTILLKGSPVRPYNSGSDAALSIAELANLVKQLLLPGGEVVIAQQAQPGQLPARYVPSTERALCELGLKTWVSLPDAIRRTAAWYAS